MAITRLMDLLKIVLFCCKIVYFLSMIYKPYEDNFVFESVSNMTIGKFGQTFGNFFMEN